MLFGDHCDGTRHPAIDQPSPDLRISCTCEKCPVGLICKVLLEISASFINGPVKPLCLVFVYIGRYDQFSARPAYTVKF